MTEIPATPSFRLDSKRALVTGGAQGIGLACTVALAEAGAKVTVASRDLVKIQAVIKNLDDKGLSVQGHQLDASKVDEIRQFFQAHDPFDVVVNSSGMARHRLALDTTESDYDVVMDLNAKGAFFLAAEAARQMERLGGGSIIQISSQMGLQGGVERTVYCASKHAVEGMTKAMAIEWAPKRIRVNSICPTFIKTALTESTLKDPEKVSWIKSKIKLGRLGELEDIMGAVVFLAADASSLVTGTHIIIDGGWTAG